MIRVLLKIARGSGPYHAAVLSALDIPDADRLVGMGLAYRGALEGWYGITEQGVIRAKEATHEARS